MLFLFVICYLLFVICYLLFVICYLLFAIVIYYLLFVICYLLFVICYFYLFKFTGDYEERDTITFAFNNEQYLLAKSILFTMQQTQNTFQVYKRV